MVRVVFVPLLLRSCRDYDWVFVFFVPGRKNAVVQKKCLFVLGFLDSVVKKEKSAHDARAFFFVG